MDMCYDGVLVMPSDYVVMDEEEMMYVEGGKFNLSAARIIVFSAVGYCIGKLGVAIGKSAISQSAIGAAIKVAGAWVANIIDTAILTVMCYPGKVAATIFAIAAVGVAGYAIYKAGKKAKIF